jgi:hypothetical protein
VELHLEGPLSLQGDLHFAKLRVRVTGQARKLVLHFHKRLGPLCETAGEILDLSEELRLGGIALGYLSFKGLGSKAQSLEAGQGVVSLLDRNLELPL